MHKACASLTPSGTSIIAAEYAEAFCAYPPLATGVKTRRPEAVLPTTSMPGINGSFCGERYEFSV
ncbi:unannotated protein [freshwater metagenome]|uniref:Unannotated protein n=1 Tax=freshwater metagenome TaxID=449393 RepID=A0A6J7B650_9ZZZZ